MVRVRVWLQLGLCYKDREGSGLCRGQGNFGVMSGKWGYVTALVKVKFCIGYYLVRISACLRKGFVSVKIRV